MVKELKGGLFDMNTMCNDLHDKVSKHCIQLGYLVENPNKADAGIIKTEHEDLEEETAQFLKSFQGNRKEVFTITEYVIDSEKLANIMET